MPSRDFLVEECLRHISFHCFLFYKGKKQIREASKHKPGASLPLEVLWSWKGHFWGHSTWVVGTAVPKRILAATKSFPQALKNWKQSVKPAKQPPPAQAGLTIAIILVGVFEQSRSSCKYRHSKDSIWPKAFDCNENENITLCKRILPSPSSFHEPRFYIKNENMCKHLLITFLNPAKNLYFWVSAIPTTLTSCVVLEIDSLLCSTATF